jgi:hypothetical protein
VQHLQDITHENENVKLKQKATKQTSLGMMNDFSSLFHNYLIRI